MAPDQVAISNVRFDMEHRTDLEIVLLNGLPDDERQHVVSAMERATSVRLRHLRSEGLRSNAPVDDLFDDDHIFSRE